MQNICYSTLSLWQQEEALREDRKKREALREKERQQEYEAELEQKKREVCSSGQ